MKLTEYLLNNAISIDQFCNTLAGGSPDETLSARAYRLAQQGKPMPQAIINALFFWQPQHCYQAYMSEILRKQYPLEYQLASY
jgi:hypothetical protein